MTRGDAPGDTVVQASKAALRRRVLAARAAVPADVRAAASAGIRQRLATLEPVRRARTILGYAAFGSEADLDPLLTDLARQGRGVFLPRVAGDQLEIARIHDLTGDVTAGWKGVREPRRTGKPPARIDRIEAVLAPGLAFDLRGRRLGYGGGYFDRLLDALRPDTTVIGVAFDLQLVDVVPVETHDRPVHVLVTESRVVEVTG